MTSRLAIWCIAACVVAIASGAAAADITSARERELTTLLLHDCGACHGLTMKGGLGPPLLPSAVAATSDETLIDIIMNGVPGTPMPPWRFEIAPEEAIWLARLLKRGMTDEN